MIVGVATLNLERIVYGVKHSIGKLEAHISQIKIDDINLQKEEQNEVVKGLIQGLEHLAKENGCDNVKIPDNHFEDALYDLEYCMVTKGKLNFYVKEL